MTAAAPPRRLPVLDLGGSLRAIARTLAIVAVLLAIWAAAAWFVRATGNTAAAARLPYPWDVAAKMITAWPTFLEAAWQTGSRAVVGFLVGLLVGGAFGVLMVQSRLIEAALVPYILASQMIPLIALVPVLRAVLRDADLVRLYVCAYVTFFIVSIAVLRGLKNAGPTSLELMASLDASRWRTLWTVRFPSALPFIFSGLRIAAPLALIGAILVDFLGARGGIGYLLVASLSIGSSQATILWGALVLALALGLVFTRAVAYVERRLCFWTPAYRRGAA
jgi:NitT/TauT family transport system permease protein